MSTKAFTSHEESFIGYKKLHQPSREGDYHSDSDDEHYYDDYEPQSLFDEDAMFCEDEYEPFVDTSQERKSCVFSGRTILKPIDWKKLSPSKSPETKPRGPKTSTWWDSTQVVDESKRLVNGVINYSAILPPPTKREVVKVAKKKKKSTTTQSKVSGPEARRADAPRPSCDGFGRARVGGLRSGTLTPEGFGNVDQQPTRLCVSVLRNAKQCFHKERCRFAHDYADLKECNFGERCKKVTVVSRSSETPTSVVYHNKPEGTTCTFKHANESLASYLHRIPQPAKSGSREIPQAHGSRPSKAHGSRPSKPTNVKRK